MKDMDSCDFYLLQHLRQCGIDGQPLPNLFVGLPFKVTQIFDSLQRLEQKGLLRLSRSVDGWVRDAETASLSDLRQRVTTIGFLIPAPIPAKDGTSWKTENADLFDGLDRRFSCTNVKLTLRGHLAATVMKDKESKGWSWPVEIVGICASWAAACRQKLIPYGNYRQKQNQPEIKR